MKDIKSFFLLAHDTVRNDRSNFKKQKFGPSKRTVSHRRSSKIFDNYNDGISKTGKSTSLYVPEKFLNEDAER
ncbi:hypothetical protein BCAH1134_A0094 [Bacillus cereus AH1134]|nr:hypothetical protein BCAH1134_A0094 [Bacillus cereus AH1134]